MAHQFILTMRDLRRVHPPDKEVLRGVNISMYPGAKIGVLGLNGAGKSTLLRIIAGDDDGAKATVGDVLVSFGWPAAVDVGGIEGSRELEALCILWVKIGVRRGAWDHGFKLLTG